MRRAGLGLRLASDSLREEAASRLGSGSQSGSRRMRAKRFKYGKKVRTLWNVDVLL